MFLDVTRGIQTPGTEFPFSVYQDIPSQDILGEKVTFDKATVAGVFSGVGERIFIRGSLTTKAYAQCANCLAPAEAPVEVSFSETFAREADSADPELFTFEGSKVDLAELAVSLSVLALPMRFLCKEDCQGMCGTCGKDFNHCTCQKENRNRHPFEALQQLLTKDEEV